MICGAVSATPRALLVTHDAAAEGRPGDQDETHGRDRYRHELRVMVYRERPNAMRLEHGAATRDVR